MIVGKQATQTGRLWGPEQWYPSMIKAQLRGTEGEVSPSIQERVTKGSRQCPLLSWSAENAGKGARDLSTVHTIRAK